MSVETTKLPKSKVVVILSILLGLLNALFWIIVGARIQFVDVWQVSIWWILFCLLLNISVALAISQQRTRQLRRVYWIIGVTLFITITCAFILGYWFGYGATDFGGLAFLSGVLLGGFIGLPLGITVGIRTSSSRFSSVMIIQRISEGIVTSTIIGIVITAISVFIFVAFTWLKDYQDNSNYSDLLLYVMLGVLLIIPAGVIPSTITGVTTTLTVYSVSWWLKMKSPILYEKVG